MASAGPDGRDVPVTLVGRRPVAKLVEAREGAGGDRAGRTDR